MIFLIQPEMHGVYDIDDINVIHLYIYIYIYIWCT